MKMEDKKELKTAGCGSMCLDDAKDIMEEVLGEFGGIADDFAVGMFIAGMNFALVPEDADMHGKGIVEYFRNSYRVAKDDSEPKSGIGIGIGAIDMSDLSDLIEGLK